MLSKLATIKYFHDEADYDVIFYTIWQTDLLYYVFILNFLEQ